MRLFKDENIKRIITNYNTDNLAKHLLELANNTGGIIIPEDLAFSTGGSRPLFKSKLH